MTRRMRVGMTGGRGARGNSDSGLPHTGVEGEGLGFSDPDFSESGMRGVEQIVLFLGDDGRGPGQARAFPVEGGVLLSGEPPDLHGITSRHPFGLSLSTHRSFPVIPSLFSP